MAANPFGLNYWVTAPLGITGYYQQASAATCIAATGIFALVPTCVVQNSLDVFPNNDEGGAICQRSGIWYGGSQLVQDGTGLLVGFNKQLDGDWDWAF